MVWLHLSNLDWKLPESWLNLRDFGPNSIPESWLNLDWKLTPARYICKCLLNTNISGGLPRRDLRTANLVSLMELFELTFFLKKSGENRSKLSCCSIFYIFISIISSTQQRTVIFINMFFSSPSDSTFKECQVILKSGIWREHWKAFCETLGHNCSKECILKSIHK